MLSRTIIPRVILLRIGFNLVGGGEGGGGEGFPPNIPACSQKILKTILKKKDTILGVILPLRLLRIFQGTCSQT